MNIENLLKNKWVWGVVGISLLAIVITALIGKGKIATQSLPAQITQPLTAEEGEGSPAKEQEPPAEEELPIPSAEEEQPPVEEEPNETYSEPEPEPEPKPKPEPKIDPCADVDCPDCQYCSLGSCVNYCQGTDNSCGCTNCVNCNKSDGWVDKGTAYYCCGDNKTCVCQKQEYRDYQCKKTSCSFSVIKTRINKTNCVDCGSNQRCFEGTCLFTKIEGLTAIRIGGGVWQNWDADAEKDGPFIYIVYLDSQGNIIANDATATMPISADVKLYTTDRSDFPYKKGRLIFSAHYSENQIILGDIYPEIRIPKEQISVNRNTDYWCGYVNVTIYTPEQGSFADEDDFIKLYEE